MKEFIKHNAVLLLVLAASVMGTTLSYNISNVSQEIASISGETSKIALQTAIITQNTQKTVQDTRQTAEDTQQTAQKFGSGWVIPPTSAGSSAVSSVYVTNATSTYLLTTLSNVLTAATSTGSYLPSASGWTMDGFKDMSLSLTLKAATSTVECTNDSTGANWYDVSQAGFDKMTNSAGDSSFGSYTAVTSTYFVDWSDVDSSLCRLKIVNDITTSTSIIAHLKRLY
jgi:hypothetical protein